MLLLYLPFLIAVIFTLAATGDLVFAARTGWPPKRKTFSWIALLLLLTTAGASIALLTGTKVNPSRMLLMIAFSAVLSILVAMFAAGRFRWFTILAAVAWLLSVHPLAGILTAPGALR